MERSTTVSAAFEDENLIFIHGAGWEGAGAMTTGTRRCVRIGVIPDSPINKAAEQDVIHILPLTACAGESRADSARNRGKREKR